MTLRKAPVELIGSGIGGQAALTDAAAAYDSLLQQVAAGEMSSTSSRCRSPMSSTSGRKQDAAGASCSSPEARYAGW